MSIAPEKQRELEIKLAVLADDLEYWTGVTKDGAKFEKHHSQVGRVAAQLTAAKSALETEAQEAVAAASSDLFRPLLSDALDLHRLWEFFRSKLAQRLAPNFVEYLEAADEFAWDVYRPVVTMAGATRREPPLTFFSTEPTPFAMWRDRSYQFALGGVVPRRREAADIVKTLPVPMIGMPWVQLGHVPDLLFLAHEVGHEVEEELRLTKAIDAAVKSAVTAPLQQAAWRSWGGETFGDVYGTLAAGPEFTRHLLALTLTGSNVAEQRRTAKEWGTYPTAALRVLVSIAVLKASSFAKTGADIERDWRGRIAAHPMQTFEAVIVPIVESLLALPLPNGHRLADLEPFTPADDERVEEGAAALLDDEAPDVTTVRQAVAAAARAFRTDSAAYVSAKAHERTLKKILAIRTPGVLHDTEAARDSVRQHAESDRHAGAGVLSAMRKIRVRSANVQ